MSIQLHHVPLQPVVESSREGALTRLREWQSIAPRYALQEDLVASNLAGASCLGRYLTHRQLLEEEVLNTLLAQFPPTVIRRFFGELCHRTYWKGWMEQHPNIWTELKNRLGTINGELDSVKLETLDRAVHGTTDLDCFNAWNEELRCSGYLHNQVRMWYASIWVFTLRLPWELGAAHFLHHMLDGDVASNTLSWRSIAGLQAPFRPFLADAEDIRNRSRGRFAPTGQLCTRVDTLADQPITPLVPLTTVEPTDATLRPCLSESPAGLLLTCEDLVPEVGVMSEAPFHSIAAFAPHDVFNAVGLSDRVVEYKREAMGDAAERAATHWDGVLWELSKGCASVSARTPQIQRSPHETCMRVYSEVVDAWVPAVVRWARTERLSVVRMHAPATGPWRDRLEKLEACLARHGICLKVYRRRWDALHWPHANGDYDAFNVGLEERLAAFFGN